MTIFVNGKAYEAGELVAYVENLEKENAELNEKLLTEKRLTTMQDETVVTMTDKLIKAKSVIQALLDNQPSPSSMYSELDLVGWRESLKSANDFLNNKVEK